MVDPRIGGPSLLRSKNSDTAIPSTAGWEYFENGRWIQEKSLAWKPEYSTPNWFMISSTKRSPASSQMQKVMGLYQRMNSTHQSMPVYKMLGGDYFFYYSSDKHWMVGSNIGSNSGILRSVSTEDMESPLMGWMEYTDEGWVRKDGILIEPYNGNLHDGILHEEVELRKIWDDHGTHAVSDFSCWNPILPNEEFVLLSSIPMGSYKKPNKGFVFTSTDKDAFKDPIDFRFIWNDKGTDANEPFSIWKPICPDSYKALGVLCQDSRRRPQLSVIKCVHDIYVRSCLNEWVWDDENTGSPKNVTIFKTLDPYTQGMEAARLRIDTLPNSDCLV